MANRIFTFWRPRYRYRRADNGQICSRLYALLHPATTIKEKVDDELG